MDTCNVWMPVTPTYSSAAGVRGPAGLHPRADRMGGAGGRAGGRGGHQGPGRRLLRGGGTLKPQRMWHALCTDLECSTRVTVLGQLPESCVLCRLIRHGACLAWS